MGRAQQHRQAITIRFNDDDAELVEWLGQFAQTSNMTKVVKLACYLLSGIQPQEGLLALMPEERFEHATPARPHKTASTTRDIHATLTAVTQEMMALRQEISEQRLQHAPETYHARTQGLEDATQYNIGQHAGGWLRPSPAATPPNDTVVAASPGLDMSRRRRGAPIRPATTGWSPPRAPEFDAEASSRLLVKTIREFSSNLQRG